MRPSRYLGPLVTLLLLPACTQPTPAPAADQETDDGVHRLQGQVPLADQESGRSQKPYSWNMRLVGQQDIQNRGANGNLAWVGDCGYVASYFGGTDPQIGLAVVDASQPKNPELVKIMPGTPGTRESQVDANETRKIVITMPFRHPKSPYGDPPGPSKLQIYDVSGDCKAPKLMSEYDFGDIVTHEHLISKDGNTVYATVGGGRGVAVNSTHAPLDPSLIAVDISDLSHPKEISRWDMSDEPGMPDSGIHDLDLSDDGTRAYTNLTYTTDSDGVYHRGLTILDTTEIQQRKPNPKMYRISTYSWSPPESREPNSHTAQLVHIQGRTYVICMDESGQAVTIPTRVAPWGMARIIDVTEEKYPEQVSIIKLEVTDKKNEAETNKDGAYYSTHYIGVDNRENTSLAFIGWMSSGVRVWDIRDPLAPKEIGYYIPGAKPNARLPGVDLYPNKKVDYVYSFIRYRPETGHIWFNGVYNGFMIAELIDNPLRPNSQSAH